ncbi:MAG: toll/interleukin-1 receptor domain-containing protein [Armatimonadetes bacterium]|nr:toll/interleukin-1 receptor domain-containing protein [Akkermansiaceae bacterium]
MTTQSPAPRRIFISYSREDKKHAKKLADFLVSCGHIVWWDQEIHAGTDYRQEIAVQLKAADKVIVLWTSHSVKSTFVIDEAQRANHDQKLIPVTMDVSEPPMGFGHLHAVCATDLESEFPAILAAVESRPAPNQAHSLRKLKRQKKVLIAFVLVLILGSIGAYVASRPSASASLDGLNPALDYVWYYSESLGVRFPYPQAALMVDTTHESEGRIPLRSRDRKEEVVVSVSRVPSHNNPRLGREDELQNLKKEGATVNYLGPSNESNWKDWYAISGTNSNGDEFYIRRWYTDRDVVSIEFEYSADKIGLYNDAIGAMTLGGRFQIVSKKH